MPFKLDLLPRILYQWKKKITTDNVKLSNYIRQFFKRSKRITERKDGWFSSTLQTFAIYLFTDELRFHSSRQNILLNYHRFFHVHKYYSGWIFWNVDHLAGFAINFQTVDRLFGQRESEKDKYSRFRLKIKEKRLFISLLSYVSHSEMD